MTRRDLDHLSDWQVIVLPNAVCLGTDEVESLRAFVAGGGSLLASKHTSLITQDGERLADFALADVFGVSYAGETTESVTYVAPSGVRDELFPGFSPTFPVTLYDSQLRVTAHPGAEVLATVTLPYTDPDRGPLRGHPDRPAWGGHQQPGHRAQPVREGPGHRTAPASSRAGSTTRSRRYS